MPTNHLGPDRLRVTIAGGGPAAIEALLALRALAEERVELELTSPSDEFVYRPLAVAEPFGGDPPQSFSLARLAQDCGASHRIGRLVGVDARRHRALLADGSDVDYGALVIAIGAIQHPALPGAITFTGRNSRELEQMLDEIHAGRVRRVVFAVPGGVVWSLPLYELALMTAEQCHSRRIELAIVTPEDAPLALFGRQGSAAVAAKLRDAGIRLHTATYPALVEEDGLLVTPGGRIPADLVVSLPRLEGPRLAGIPHDTGGFIRTDRHGRVHGAADVYAAGDATTFPVKQGGLATQQADALAATLAAAAGAPVEPHEFDPVLRGLLLAGGSPTYLRAELRGGRGDTSKVDADPLWWPPGKIVGRYLSNYLARVTAAAQAPTSRFRAAGAEREHVLHG
jgi:sulfide:quinone oxidoreductase